MFSLGAVQGNYWLLQEERRDVSKKNIVETQVRYLRDEKNLQISNLWQLYFVPYS